MIVSQYNSWLRLAIDEYLRGVLRYVEAVVLAGPGDTTTLAFDVPWRPGRSSRYRPGWLPSIPGAGKLCWPRALPRFVG